MKRKELMKFLAIMMSVATITGSGVPVMAADVDFGDVSVEMQDEDVEMPEEDQEDVDLDVEADAEEDTAEPEVDVQEETEMEEDTENTEADGVFSDEAGAAVQDDEAAQTFKVSGQLFDKDGGTYTSASRDAEVLSTTSTSNGMTFTDVNLTFESSDGWEDGKPYIRLKPELAEGDTLVIGNSTSKNGIASLWTQNDDGTFACTNINYYGYLAQGKGPAKAETYLYCKLTHADGTSQYYRIHVVRKGYAFVGLTSFGSSEKNPFSGYTNSSTFDSKTGRIRSYYHLYEDTSSAWGDYGWLGGQMSPLLSGLAVYDENGDKVTVDKSNAKVKVNPDYKGDLYTIDESDDLGYFYTNRAGGSKDFLVLEYDGNDYPIYLQFKYYSYQAKTLISNAATDGVTSLSKTENNKTMVDTDSFATAEDFAALFPEKDQETAKKFYDLVTDCYDVINNGSGSGEGSWDYDLASVNPNVQLWTETCESAKTNQIVEMAPALWKNIYGMKDAKAAIEKYAHAAVVKDENLTELRNIVNDALEQIDAGYTDKTITSMAAVQDIEAQVKSKIDAISLINLENCEVTLDASSFTYDGTEKTPAVTVKAGENVLPAGDYEVVYSNNTDAGTATVTVTGKDNAYGTKTVNFVINALSQKVSVSQTSYNVIEGDPAFNLKADAMKDASLAYKSSNTKVASVDKAGKVTINGAGTATITVTASAKNYEDAAATVTITVAKNLFKKSSSSFTKTQGAKTFGLGVKTTTKATVSYKTSSKGVATVSSKGIVTVKGPGKAVITVTAKVKGMADQTKKITITVKPSSNLAPAAQAKKGKKLQVSWKRNSKVTGYEISYSTDKNFKKDVKVVTINKKATTKTTIKNLKAGKKYYVRVRSFKKVSGGTVYSNWKKSASVKAIK